MYDLDDLEDSDSDGVAAQADFDALSPQPWQYNQDVHIVLTGLTEATLYDWLYCYAEDDEDDGVGGDPNGMLYSLYPIDASNVEDVQVALGAVTTLDESPPSFTVLKIEDPTAADDRIVVTFALNEAGTAYCRATRQDSGEAASDVPINRILTADWSAAWISGTATIEITNLERATPTETNRDDEKSAIHQQSQYDVYCWAQDEAVDTRGWSISNYMTQNYVSTRLESGDGDVTSPSGGNNNNNNNNNSYYY